MIFIFFSYVGCTDKKVLGAQAASGPSKCFAEPHLKPASLLKEQT